MIPQSLSMRSTMKVWFELCYLLLNFPHLDLVGDVLKQRPEISEYEDNVILVFGLPAVGTERYFSHIIFVTKI